MPDLARLRRTVPMLEGVEPVRELGGGPASRSWLLHSPRGAWVLREDLPLAARLGLDRAAEWRVLQQAHAADLAPEPVWRDTEAGLLLTGYLRGKAWTPAMFGVPGNIEILARLLRRVHDLPLPADCPRLDPLAAAGRYARAGRRTVRDERLSTVAGLAQELYAPEYARHLCHHDPSCANLLGHAGPRLIDWEYAAAGRPLFDLAVVVRYHALERAQADRLLACWSGGQAVARDEFRAFCRLYDLLAGLWQEAASPWRLPGESADRRD